MTGFLDLTNPFFLSSIKVQVHEIGFAECPKSYVFRGTKEYTPKQIQDILGLSGNTVRPAGQPPAGMQPNGQSTMTANR